VCASNFDIICLSDTWLNDLCYNHNLFPNRYTIYLSDQPYINKVGGGGVSTAITASLGSCNRSYELELCSECVWVEIPTADGINMYIGNHYVSPDTNPEVITNYFHHLENSLDTNNTSVILLGDFNAPGFNRESKTPLPKCHYYSMLHISSWPKAVEAVGTLNMLDLVFANFTNVKSVPTDSGMVTLIILL
jgi:exonuclease III